jgi:hypothetical protein
MPNDSDFMLEVLSDGKSWSTMDIIYASVRQRGCGITPHSRASDLRRRGHNIECSFGGKVAGRSVWTYKLVASPPTPPLSDGVPLPIDEDTHDGKHDHAHVGRGGAEGEGEQPLFTYPRSPEWA